MIRRTMPTRTLLQGAPYTGHLHTDLRARFAAMQPRPEPKPAPDFERLAEVLARGMK